MQEMARGIIIHVTLFDPFSKWIFTGLTITAQDSLLCLFPAHIIELLFCTTIAIRYWSANSETGYPCKFMKFFNNAMTRRITAIYTL